jgi:hypothetical protein
MKAEFGVRCDGAEPLLYEISKPGRTATTLPALEIGRAHV